MILASFIFFTFMGVYYAYEVATPIFRSSAVVMLNNRDEQVVDIGNIVGGLGSDTTVVNTEVEVLRSRTLLRKVVNTLDLTEDPEFNTALSPPTRLTRFKESIKSVLGLGSPEIERSAEVQARIAQERAIDTLLEQMTVRNIPQSLVFRVTVQSTSATKAALIADTMVDLYIQNQLEVKFEATEQATTWLADRVADLQAELETAEERVKNFRGQIDLISPEMLQAAEVQLKETRDRISDLQASLATQRARLEELEAADTREQRLEASGNDPQLTRLMDRLDEPSVATAFDQAYGQLIQNARQNIQRSAAQLTALQKSIEERERDVERQNSDLITLNQLTREAESKRLLYQYFLNRFNETSAQQGIQQTDSRPLSYAVVPVSPFAPRKSFVMAVSGFAGLIVGGLIVLLHEARQNGFRTAAELSRETGVPVYGEVPLIPRKRRLDAIQYLHDKPTSAATESIRNLRTSIMLSDVDNPPKVIMTTSSVPGEGKTSIALSLAMNFATMDKRTLLIEADVRRSIFSQYVVQDFMESPGVVGVLADQAGLDDVIHRDAFFGADLMVGGKAESNAADLFSSKRFEVMMTELARRYDHIIVDTPPVLAVPDARIIAQHVDATIYVVKWDSTPNNVVQAGLEEFRKINLDVTCMVLNQINSNRMKKYGYDGEYGSYGSKYYTN